MNFFYLFIYCIIYVSVTRITLFNLKSYIKNIPMYDISVLGRRNI